MDLIYRGTAEQIGAEKDKAKEWLRAQIDKAVAESKEIPPEHKAIYANEGIDIWHETKRQSGYGNISPFRTKEHEDYFHVWKIQKEASGWGYGHVRITIRKNKTINMRSVMAAVATQLRQRAATHKSDGMRSENRKLWMDQFGKTPKEWGDENKVEVALSPSTRGAVQIKLRAFPWRLSYRGTVRIADVVPVLQTLKRCDDQMVEYESIRKESK